MKQFFLHVNNHKNRKSFQRMTSKEKKKAQHSYTVAGILEGNTFRFGVATCSKEDFFEKAKGREIALFKAGTSGYVEIPDYILKTGELGKYFSTKAKRLIIANDKVRLHRVEQTQA